MRITLTVELTSRMVVSLLRLAVALVIVCA